MTTQLEKIFFNFILKNKKYFEMVKPYFFKNSEIQFIYNIVRTYMSKNSEVKIPTSRQILDMVSLEDKEGNITKEILKSILNVDLRQYSEEDFIIPKINTWILSNKIKTGAVDIVEETRNVENITEFEKAVESVSKIKEIVQEMSSINFIKDDDLGSDFDDPESHIQDSSIYKISCGFSTIDHMLGGGWDISTLNVIMAETSNGKCFLYNTICKFKNKSKNEQLEEEIGKIFSEISKEYLK